MKKETRKKLEKYQDKLADKLISDEAADGQPVDAELVDDIGRVEGILSINKEKK